MASHGSLSRTVGIRSMRSVWSKRAATARDAQTAGCPVFQLRLVDTKAHSHHSKCREIKCVLQHSASIGHSVTPVPPQARIYDNETNRDRTTLKKNLPIQIHLDVTGSLPCGDSSQPPLSPEAYQHRQEVWRTQVVCLVVQSAPVHLPRCREDSKWSIPRSSGTFHNQARLIVLRATSNS